MRYLQVNVSGDGFRHPQDNGRRCGLLEKIVEEVIQPWDLVVLPAGFVSYKNTAWMRESAQWFSDVAQKARVTLIGGMDCVKSPGHHAAGCVEHGTLPYFGFAVGNIESANGAPRIWRQTSSTSADFRSALLRPDAGRVLSVPEGDTRHRAVLALLCGELYRRDIDALLRSESMPLVAVMGHYGMTEPHGSIVRVSGVTEGDVALSQHFTLPTSRLHFGTSGAYAPTLPNAEGVISVEHQGLWAKVIARTV